MRVVSLYCILWATINGAVVRGNYLFILDINSITAPTNRTFDGSCCVCCEEQGACSDPCDIWLRLCLRPAGFDHSDPSCPLQELYGDPRPRITHLAIVGTWPGAIQLYIRATHSVGELDQQTELTDDQLIDTVFIEISNLTSFSPPTAVEIFTGDAERLEADLQFGVGCDFNHYGPNCEVECQDDEGGRYFCNRNGDWECLAGYQNLENNCTECIAADGCMNGYCDAPFNCVCMDGWSGDLCTQCVLSENCSSNGGYCIMPGECLCRDGYSGDNCTITATSTALTSTARVHTSTITPTPSAVPPLYTSSELAAFSSPLAVSSSMTPSLTEIDQTTTSTSEFTTTPLIPTVGGLIPESASRSGPGHMYLPITVVAAVGGLLLLLILIIGIIAVAVQRYQSIARFRERGLFNSRRMYEISTTGSDANGHTQNDENRLLNNTTPTSQQNDIDVTFTTFRNRAFPPEQPLQGELHIYHHHNTPEPVSMLEREEEGEGGGVQSVEMEFPSGYTDPWPDGTIESHLQWSSVRSDRGEHLNKNGRDGGATNGSHTSFNDYQFN